MGARIEYKKGEEIGNYGVTFVKDISRKKLANGRDVRMALLMCSCGNEFECRIQNVKINKKKSCGCFSPRKEYEKGEPVNGLTFVVYTGAIKDGRRIGKFICACGKEFEAPAALVTFGKIKSCGCMRGGSNRILYKKGDVAGDYGIVFIEEISNRRRNSGREAIFRCTCGKEFQSIINNIRGGGTKTCGCSKKTAYLKKECSHGYSNHYLYTSWSNIKRRCYCEHGKDYPYYGGRGIRMSDEFIHDAKNFIEYIMSLPNFGVKGYTLDRIKNDGDYTRENLRWASKTTQSINQRKRMDVASGFTGVYPYNKQCAWMSIIHCNKETFRLGVFDEPEDAARARDRYIIENKLPHRLSGLPLTSLHV